MQTRQIVLSEPTGARGALAALVAIEPQLAFLFASPRLLEDGGLLRDVTAALPGTRIIGCSTAGEISDAGVAEGTAVLTAVRFREPSFRTARVPLVDMASSADCGRRLAAALAAPDLSSLVVYGQGVRINGSALIQGIVEVVGPHVPVMGGLAGDDGAFQRTFTVLDGVASPEDIVGLAFYGQSIRIAHGSFGGWQPFGPPRRITRAAGNVLYELDGAPALDLYKRYLGDYAKGLPAAGLMFPFELLDNNRSEIGLIRTILGIDEQTRSLTLAGDVAQGGYLRLMHASADSLVEGAEAAARAAHEMQHNGSGGLTVLVSCVGRRIVMGGRVDEEVEAVADVYGRGTTIAGFYSYGEISPYHAGPECKLHNQTMTVMHLHER